MGEHAAGQIDPPDDTHGSGEYRRTLTATLVSRALAEASRRPEQARP
jgi:carbon-monoxide dehydrogenase medium subunit